MLLKQASNLIEFNDRFHRIIDSTDSDYEKQCDLERLESDMEIVFEIPPMTDTRFEEENPEVMSLYRNIKRQRVYI